MFSSEKKLYSPLSAKGIQTLLFCPREELHVTPIQGKFPRRQMNDKMDFNELRNRVKPRQI